MRRVRERLGASRVAPTVPHDPRFVRRLLLPLRAFYQLVYESVLVVTPRQRDRWTEFRINKRTKCLSVPGPVPPVPPVTGTGPGTVISGGRSVISGRA